MVQVKICGLCEATTLDAALAAGADLVGLVHFPRSPRHVTLAEARALADRARGRSGVVVLLVDPDDALLDAAVEAIAPDLIQLHGHETPERTKAVRDRAGRPVMKALGIATHADLDRLEAYAGTCDRLLLDARPAEADLLPGGNGRAFDWSLLDGAHLPAGTMLSGGLTPETVAEALARTRLRAVDVSSGVERSPGEKDPARIAAFVAAARGP